MKKTIVLVVIFIFVGFFAFAEEKKEEKTEPLKWCPKTLISDNDKCMECHVMSGGKFVLKETKPDAHINYPFGTEILNYGTEEAVGFYFLNGTITLSEASLVRNYLNFLGKHGIKKAIIEIYSGGGSVFAGWRIKGYFDQWRASGGIVETQVMGVAGSAATIIFLAGNKGYRQINPQAELMFHELWTFKLFDFATPSDKEDEAKVLRHLQDTISAWIASRSKLSKEELDERIRKKEFWINGEQALELGFADRVTDAIIK